MYVFVRHLYPRTGGAIQFLLVWFTFQAHPKRVNWILEWSDASDTTHLAGNNKTKSEN